jgi:cytosine/creatinine deaminase
MNWKNSTSSFNLILRQGRLAAGGPALVDIGVADGRIVEIAPRIVADAPEECLDGRLVIAGFVESHIHLDKSELLQRCNCEGTPATCARRQRIARKRPVTLHKH